MKRQNQKWLALAVARYLSGYGMAYADNPEAYIDVDNGNKVVATAPPDGATLSPAAGETATNKQLTVTGGNWYYLYGGKATSRIRCLWQSGQEYTTAENGTALLNSETPTVTVKSHDYTPTKEGVTINYTINHQVSIDPNNSYKNVLLTVTAPVASKISFGDVKWLNSGALIDHSTQYTNISFEKAAIDTSKIHFTTGGTRSDGDIMTLVNAFGTSVGGSIGGPDGMNFTDANGKTGKGHAYFQSGNLKYLVTTGTTTETEPEPEPTPEPEPEPTPEPTPDTDKDDAIKEGGDNVSGQVEGDVKGGVAKRNGVAKKNIKNVEEGSTVNGSVTAAISVAGLASDNQANVNGSEVKGNVTAADSQTGNAANNVATVKDKANNLLHDDLGNSYGYNKRAPYHGFHLGVGKLISTGTANGLAIRKADTGGGSVKLELGATMRSSQDSPWKLDLNLTGFADKKRGVSGGLSIAYLF